MRVLLISQLFTLDNRSHREMVLRGFSQRRFSDSAGLDATSANGDPFHRSGGQNDTDILKVREKPPARDACNLLSNPSFFLGHTASCD